MLTAESIYPSEAQRDMIPVNRFHVSAVGNGWIYMPWSDEIGDDCKFFGNLSDLMIFAIANAGGPVH